jgi:SAM-dependent methyltransferase
MTNEAKSGDFGVPAADMDAALEPFIVERFKPSDPAWNRSVTALERSLRRMRRRRQLKRLVFAWRGNTQNFVRRVYNNYWAEDRSSGVLGTTGDRVLGTWNGQGFQIAAHATRRIHQLFMMRAIAILRPRTVLEVGCGRGQHLLTLACRFPDIHFTGLELTQAGVQATEAVIAQPVLPDSMAAFAAEPLRDLSAHRRVEVVQGTAASLPFPDRAFDLVYTSLALEQMEAVRPAALSEVARVVGRHAMFTEPWRDYNESGPGLDYVLLHGYFRGRIADLSPLGLRPIYATDTMPQKVQMRTGFVVAERI